MKKVWVKESTEKDSDGEVLQVVEVFDSKVSDFSYLVFFQK